MLLLLLLMLMLVLVLVLARRGGSGGSGGEPTVRGRRVSSLYKVRATSIIISREPRQDGAPDWQTPSPHVPTESLFKPSLTSSCFLLCIALPRPDPPANDDRRVSACRDRGSIPSQVTF